MPRKFWKLSFSFISLLGPISTGSHAQPAGLLPLKNWPAPISWQATSPLEREAARVSAPVADELSPRLAGANGSTQYSVLVAITPCRLVDTRSSMPAPYGAGASYPNAISWAAGSTHSILVPGLAGGIYAYPWGGPFGSFPACSLPAAQAYSANITVMPPAGMPFTFLSVCPTGTSTSVCSATATLTAYEGYPNVSGPSGTNGNVVSNAAVIPANGLGSFDVYVYSATAIVIDINGYYVSPAALTLGAGTAGQPSLAFTGDTSSGIYSSGTGAVSVAAGGANRLTVSSSGLDVTGDINLSGGLRFQGSLGLQISAGSGNTSAGALALALNSTGTNNTALGYNALAFNSTGNQNTAGGGYALYSNTTGKFNTATGYGGLQSNVSGSYSTASGYAALQNSNGIGYNTASGAYALSANTSGQDNTASGYSALAKTTTGSQNTASGYNALYTNTVGNNNTATGFNALYFATGSNNIAVGYQAGYFVSAGSNNIHIGSQGISSDNGTVRIGSPGTQTSFFAAGIRGAVTGNGDALPVVIDSNGQLGTVNSSRRFKRDIRDLGDTTDSLLALHPVRFRYTAQDPAGPEHYGLIAEEVDAVAPELVVRRPDGQIESVYYDKVNILLLNEVQKQHRTIETLREYLLVLESRVAALEGREP